MAREEDDYYIDKNTKLLVFTRNYHIKRGYCCGNKCRHCPFIPRYKEGNTAISPEYNRVE